MTREINYYASLGLTLDATTEEIRHAYREAARRLHPDTNVEAGQTELFLDVKKAYDVLSDPVRRIAYDETLPAELKFPPPINVSTFYSRSSLPRMSGKQLVYVLIDLTAQPEATTVQSPPLNICMVLDCSTSMQGVLMDTVKLTAIELVRQLRPEDILSIVSFSDRAEVLVPAKANISRNEIETRIRLLQARGGTEIFQGLEASFSEVRQRRSRNYINHIVLITDGRTYGDEPKCIRIAEQATHLGIGISSLGIGNKWNDEFLDQLASTTGGSCMYVVKPGDIRRFLKDKFSGLAQIYAENVSYSFETNDMAQLRYTFRPQPDTAPLGIESPLRMGNLPRDMNLNLLLEFEVGAIPPDSGQVTLAEGHLTLDIPSKSYPNASMRLKLNRPAIDDPEAEAPPHVIVQAMSRLTLYRMQERARQDVSEGRVSEATRRLQNIATHLLAQGNRELARGVLAEANYLQRHKKFSENGEKYLKYGTRSLLLPANIEERTS
jgi:Ca-activated chloride channel family protein